MRTKAFTLVELLVSLIIGSIILTLAWNIYFYLGSYRGIVENKVDDQVSLKKAEYWMSRDSNKATKIELRDSILVINQSADSIIYNLGKDVLIRTKGINADTLKMSCKANELGQMNSFRICLYKGNTENCFPLRLPKSSYQLVTSLDENPEEIF